MPFNEMRRNEQQEVLKLLGIDVSTLDRQSYCLSRVARMAKDFVGVFEKLEESHENLRNDLGFRNVTKAEFKGSRHSD